jgi:signal transduction histidine kinase
VLNTTFARLEAAFRRQQQFTADASHELRTPLAVIISGAQASLARKRRGVEYRETIAVCLEAAQQIRRLTDSLLELARFDAGEEHGTRRSLDIADHARACVERLRPLAREREIEIHGDLDHTRVIANADRLERLITNLLTNAIHYNKRGGHVRVDTRTDGAVAAIAVADTGQGIAPEDLPHIFERFYRTDKSRSRAEGHSGLGLAICKVIVDAEEGRIDVRSQLGVGTTFTVRLPSAAQVDPVRT